MMEAPYIPSGTYTTCLDRGRPYILAALVVVGMALHLSRFSDDAARVFGSHREGTGVLELRAIYL
jgi:hypothetical protein